MPPITDNTNKYESQPQYPKVPIELRGFIREDEWNSLTYEQKDILSKLDSMPASIEGSMPTNVWETLSIKQKLEVLISYEMLPSISFEGDDISTEIEIPESIQEGEEYVISPQAAELDEMRETVEIADPAQAEFEEAKEMLREVESAAEAESEEIEGELSEITTLPQEQEVVDPTFEVPAVPKFTGYQPSKDLLQDIESNVNGSPTKSRTWTANIINKIWLALSPQDD